MNKIQAEINELNSQIQALQQERATLTQNHIASLVEAYRRQARENPEIAAELKGIDDLLAKLTEGIAFLEQQKQQKQAQLNSSLTFSQRLAQQQQELEAAKKVAEIHAQRVNELAQELAEEIKLLKACADELSPMYWQVYYKPFITGFKTISVPHVRSDGEVWTIVNRIV
ncbi:hypothetical protein [Sphaerospermopsis sp. LEGE 08334]|jgi:septal ring factor EnvC (AmiA/AmiB activator)|uniref:hypothetical protein n=1 Tax=Sphaerospermopsis sp. LEGE 08334 TaxID=1828651 RepID=UPI001880D952|nr:hypothetical protein [Sphaerospermopsis sp. LEGE 08334]MBE9057717.1 hypothetical protein [Sphaerospermopsis sp. LEGE 08334]